MFPSAVSSLKLQKETLGKQKSVFNIHLNYSNLLHDGNVQSDHGGPGQDDVEDAVQGEQVHQDVGVRTPDIMNIVKN